MSTHEGAATVPKKVKRLDKVVPKGTKYLGDQWTMATAGNNA